MLPWGFVFGDKSQTGPSRSTLVHLGRQLGALRPLYICPVMPPWTRLRVELWRCRRVQSDAYVGGTL